jgi:uncharacterized protein (TIGR02145 family)
VYYWDGKDWIKLNFGSTVDAGFTSTCAETPVPATGDSFSCSISDSDCKVTGEYRFTYITGENYSTLEVTDAGAGAFTLTIEANDQASSRTVILLVSSPCGDNYSYAFIQEGDGTDCGTSLAIPDILSENGASLCNSGAVYLYLSGRPASGTYIWTLNGEEVARGNHYTATRTGKYLVYADKIGCPDSKSFQVSASTTEAPSTARVFAANDGFLCSGNTTATLYATHSNESGTVAWYKDGQRISTGNTIEASAGSWQAVVEEDGCSSLPSNTVVVQDDPNAGISGISDFTFTINGAAAVDDFALCQGGSILLSVDGGGQVGVEYRWSLDEAAIGIGTTLSYTLPGLSGSPRLRCRATMSGACSLEKSVSTTLSIASLPATPYITVNTPGSAICNGSAELTANGSPTATSYRWEYTSLQGTISTLAQETQTITVENAGTYRVNAKEGVCLSNQSSPKTLIASATANVTISGPVSGINIGASKTYTAVMDNLQGAAYTWSVSGPSGTSIQSGQGTNSILVYFPTAGTATINLAATNACGTATIIPAGGLSVTVASDCTPVSVSSHSPSSKAASTSVGNGVPLSISAAGSPTLTYQWYSNTTASTSGGNIIGGATNASYSAPAATAGTYYYYCRVTSSCDASTATSDFFTVTVNADPASYPAGSGRLTGRTTFDVAMTNEGACGSLTGRKLISGLYANFADPATNTQVYTFTPASTVNNVRFVYVETSGSGIVSSLTPNGTYTGSTNLACSATLVYASDLNSKVSGKTSKEAWTVDIYAIYTSGLTDYSIKLTAQIQDCAFCGAYTTTGTWLTFMPYNLGADPAYATPADQMAYTPNPNTATSTDATVYGDLYQWGRKTDGHEKRNSATTTTLATSNTPNHAKFIKAPNSPYDWRSGGGNNSRWTDATKAANDPCPSGYKVPTTAQWRSIFNGGSSTYSYATINSSNTYNSWSFSGTGTKGAYSGGTLFLPAAGAHNYGTGTLHDAISRGYYWSSSANGARAYSMDFTSTQVEVARSGCYRASGRSVRCVAE